MINAVISDTLLSISTDNIPYLIFAFQYIDENEEKRGIETPPFALIDPRVETLDNSSMGRSLKTIFNVVGVLNWESLKGKVVRLDLIDGGKIKSIYNILENKSLPILEVKAEEDEEIPEVNENIEVIDTEEKVEE